jgi:putative NAD(P)-binding protein
MRVVVFGATGGTGLQLVKQALEAGYQVTALVRPRTKFQMQHEQLRILQGDVLDPACVDAAVTGRLDVAVHERFSPLIARPLVFILKHFLQTPEQGAKTALYLATSSIVEGVTGKYFVKGREKPSVPISYDVALQERIWKLSKTLVGLDSLPER